MYRTDTMAYVFSTLSTLPVEVLKKAIEAMEHKIGIIISKKLMKEFIRWIFSRALTSSFLTVINTFSNIFSLEVSLMSLILGIISSMILALAEFMFW
jgi:hypothetical protein